MKKFLEDWWFAIIIIIIITLICISRYTYNNSDHYRIIQSQKGDDKGVYYIQTKHWLLFSWWWTHDDGKENIKYSTKEQADWIINKMIEEDRIEEKEEELDDYKIIPYGTKEESNK